MRKIVRVSAGRVSIRTSSVWKELEPAGATGRLVAAVRVAVVRDNARSCVMRVSIRKSSVWKELGHVGATGKPADKAHGIGAFEGSRENLGRS
jgi:hypothetical protein